MTALIVSCIALGLINLTLLLFLRHTITNFHVVVDDAKDLERFCGKVDEYLNDYMKFLVELSKSEVYTTDLTFQRLMKYTKEVCNVLSRCKLQFEEEGELTGTESQE